MRSALHGILVALLVASAGCAGAFGGGTTTTASTPNATAFPPGVTSHGLTDASALVRAHEDALDGESVTLHSTEVLRYGNGTLAGRRDVTVRTAANRTRFLRVAELANSPVYGADEGRVALFVDGRHGYRSVETPNRSWVRPFRTPSGELVPARKLAARPARSDDLYVVLTDFAANDSGDVWRSVANEGRFQLEYSTVASPDMLAPYLGLDAVRNASLTVNVTADGLVHFYRLEYAGTRNGTVVRGVQTREYSRVGATTVDAPDWYPSAREQVRNRTTRLGDRTTQSDS